ncbi:hypothetical protein DPMN_067335, partial [Dreissena polymorpha]
MLTRKTAPTVCNVLQRTETIFEISLIKRTKAPSTYWRPLGIATDWYGQRTCKQIMESAVSGEESTSSIQTQEPGRLKKEAENYNGRGMRARVR